MIGNIVLLVLLGLGTGLAVGYLWKNRKQPGCGGDCTHCMGCGTSGQDKTRRK